MILHLRRLHTIDAEIYICQMNIYSFDQIGFSLKCQGPYKHKDINLPVYDSHYKDKSFLRLISVMEITMPGKSVLILRRGPDIWAFRSNLATGNETNGHPSGFINVYLTCDGCDWPCLMFSLCRSYISFRAISFNHWHERTTMQMNVHAICAKNLITYHAFSYVYFHDLLTKL